jgi:hypothetical protein
MAKKQKLEELTLEELHSQRNKIKGALTGLGIIMLILCALIIYLAVKSGNYALIAVGSGSLITLLPIMASLGTINKEIKKREQN